MAYIKQDEIELIIATNSGNSGNFRMLLWDTFISVIEKLKEVGLFWPAHILQGKIELIIVTNSHGFMDTMVVLYGWAFHQVQYVLYWNGTVHVCTLPEWYSTCMYSTGMVQYMYVLFRNGLQLENLGMNACTLSFHIYMNKQ